MEKEAPRTVYVEKPVIKEVPKIVEKPVIVERVVEKPVVKKVIVLKPVIQVVRKPVSRKEQLPRRWSEGFYIPRL